MLKKILLLLTLLFSSISTYSWSEETKTYPTAYGNIETNDPLIIELIESEPFQRLKGVHQYGVKHYTSDPEDYTRYDHSMGVFYILKLHNCSRKEQIAGLLHDVSHTAFSHVGDHFFNRVENNGCYQDEVHEWFLEKCGLNTILQKYGLSASEVSPDTGAFKALEQDLPNLCADRIDYNIQGAYRRGWLSKEETLALINDLEFKDGKWSLSDVELAKKLARFSSYMSFNCWSSLTTHPESDWLSDAMKRAIDINILTLNDIHHGKDEDIWNRLHNSDDSQIQDLLYKIKNSKDYITLTETSKATKRYPIKFRGINPLIRQSETIVPLSSIDEEFCQEFQNGFQKASEGWPIILIEEQSAA